MRQRIVLLSGLGATLLVVLGLGIGGGWTASSAAPWWATAGGGNTSSSTNYRLISTVGQAGPIGSSSNGTTKLEAGLWNATPDFDWDGVADSLEVACGTDPMNAGSFRAERIDGVFAGVDDDGDTQVDEALPSGAENNDCDGDGYKGSTEAHVFGDTNVRDQDPCGTGAWPSDFVSGGIFGSTNRVLIDDLNTFLSPRKLDLDLSGPADPNVRWDLSPGSGIFAADINIGDLNALLGGATAYPPMLGGARALGGPECPWPP